MRPRATILSHRRSLTIILMRQTPPKRCPIEPTHRPPKNKTAIPIHDCLANHAASLTAPGHPLPGTDRQPPYLVVLGKNCTIGRRHPGQFCLETSRFPAPVLIGCPDAPPAGMGYRLAFERHPLPELAVWRPFIHPGCRFRPDRPHDCRTRHGSADAVTVGQSEAFLPGQRQPERQSRTHPLAPNPTSILAPVRTRHRRRHVPRTDRFRLLPGTYTILIRVQPNSAIASLRAAICRH